jgi:hypothetical protein
MKSVKGARSAAAIVAVSLLTVSSMPVGAQGPGWTANATVVKMVVTNTGGINVRLSPELSNCVSQSGYGPLWASIYANHPGIDRMKADLLAAYLTGGTVSLYFTDSNCTVGEMLLGGW